MNQNELETPSNADTGVSEQSPSAVPQEEPLVAEPSAATQEHLEVAEKKKKKTTESKKKKKKLTAKQQEQAELEAKKKARVNSPYRKVILSRGTVQTTIPQQDKEAMMAHFGIKNMSGWLDRTFELHWNAKKGCEEITVVETAKLYPRNSA